MNGIVILGLLVNVLTSVGASVIMLWIIMGIETLIQNRRFKKLREERRKREEERADIELKRFEEKLKSIK